MPVNGHNTQAIGPGNGDDGGGGGGGILALLCGAFCKDNPLGEAFGVNDAAGQNNANASYSAVPPIQGETPFRFRGILNLLTSYVFITLLLTVFSLLHVS